MNEEHVGNTSDQIRRERDAWHPGWRNKIKKTSRARVERVKEAVRQAHEVLSRHH